MAQKSLVQASSELTLKNWRMLLYGPPKHGKTFCALTASEKFPDVEDLSEYDGPPLELDDLLFLLSDEGGLDGLAEYNITVPVIDVSREGGGLIVNSLIPKIHKEIEERVKKGVTKTVIVDAISTFDRIFKAYQADQFPDPRHQAQMYGAILGNHMKLFGSLKRLDCNVLIVAHAKFLIDLGDANQAAKKSATSMPGQSDVVPDITGAAGRYYPAAVSFQVPLLSRKMPGGKVKRTLYPLGLGRYEAGTRFTRHLDKEEPAHIQKLLRKIRDGLAQTD